MKRKLIILLNAFPEEMQSLAPLQTIKYKLNKEKINESCLYLILFVKTRARDYSSPRLDSPLERKKLTKD
jgi:hypothetical protein